MIVAELKTLAKLEDNYEADATGATAHWPDTTHYRATVPAGKRWFLFGGIVNRSDAATWYAYVRNTAGEMILQLAGQGAATGVLPYPTTATTGNLALPITMDAGWYIEHVFGVAQGVAALASALVLEVDA